MVPTYSRYAGTIIFWALVFNGDDLAERPRRIRANPASGRSVHSQTGRPTAVQHDANVVRRFSVRNSEVLLNSGSEITEVLVVVILGNKEINFLGRRIGNHGGPTSGERIGSMGEVPFSFPVSVSKVKHQLALRRCANALDLAADISDIAMAAGIAGSSSPRAYRRPVIQGNVKGVTIRLVTIIVEEAAIATAVRHRDALVFLLDVDKLDRARGGLDNMEFDPILCIGGIGIRIGGRRRDGF